MKFSAHDDRSTTALLAPARRSAASTAPDRRRGKIAGGRAAEPPVRRVPRASCGDESRHESAEETRNLLSRFRDGDPVAGDALVLRYRDRLCRYVLIHKGARKQHSLDVEDVIHDAYVKLLEKIHEFEYRGKDSVYAYLKSVADRIVLDRWRSADERRRETGDSAERFIDELLSRDPAPDASEDQRELEDLLDACVSALPGKYREVILDRYYLGGSAREVAEWLGYSNPHAVDTLCSRAKEKLICIAEPRIRRWLESA